MKILSSEKTIENLFRNKKTHPISRKGRYNQNIGGYYILFVFQNFQLLSRPDQVACSIVPIFQISYAYTVAIGNIP